MAMTAADVLIETIQGWGVDVVFGLPGDGINGIMEALRKRQKEVRFIQVRHEEAAALMAVGYAKVTNRLGVCLATSGPGGIHLLNGLYDAKLDGQPVLALTGLAYHDLINTHQQQDSVCATRLKWGWWVTAERRCKNCSPCWSGTRTAASYRKPMMACTSGGS